ncbi:MAG: VCBS repeat-containing protein, partial [Peristeroidobacter soli]
LPMFTTTLDVSYGIQNDEPGSGIATGTFKVTDANRQYPLMRQGLGYPTYDGLQVGDFDGDGDEETLIFGDTASEIDKDTTGTGYHETWAYLLGIDGINQISAAAHGDVDGDGKQELFFASGKKIIQLDGASRRVTRSVDLPLPGDLMCGELAFGDLNRDGTPELVCLGTSFGLRLLNGVEGALLVLDARTLAIVKQYPAAQYGGGMAVGNVDNDAALEIVTAAGRIYDGNAVFGARFAAEKTYAPGFGLDVRIGDVTGDAALEIVGFGDEATGSRADVRAYDARTATPTLLWTITNPEVLTLALANLSGDARPEILVGDGNLGGMRNCNITAYNARTAPPAGLFTLQTGNDLGVIALAGGDLDHDGQQEFIWASEQGEKFEIRRAVAPATLEWPTDPLVPRFVGGFGGGEVVRDTTHPTTVMFFARGSDTGGMHLTALDPTTGALTVGEDLGPPSHGNVAMAAADYDHDATDEVFLASQLGTNSADNAYYLLYDFWRANQDWRSQNFLGEVGAVGIARGDLNGNGNDDVAVMTEEGVVRVYDVVGR